MGKVEEIVLDISPLSQSDRKIFIYIPNSYDKSKKKYPVLYMFDGQNIFFDHYATYGKSWNMKEILDNYYKEMIVVGVDCNHTGDNRLIEYAPFPFSSKQYHVSESKGHITADFFTGTLKSYIDDNYRTLSDRNNTFIAGSSMGGLMTLYMIIKHNNIYSKAACLSPSILFMFDEMFDLLKNTKLDKNSKIYLDFGTRELKYKNKITHAMHALFDLNHEFQNKGVNCFPNLIKHGEHNEVSWEKTVPIFLKYFFEK